MVAGRLLCHSAFTVLAALSFVAALLILSIPVMHDPLRGRSLGVPIWVFDNGRWNVSVDDHYITASVDEPAGSVLRLHRREWGNDLLFLWRQSDWAGTGSTEIFGGQISYAVPFAVTTVLPVVWLGRWRARRRDQRRRGFPVVIGKKKSE